MKRKFEEIRFALFTCSYAGYYFSNTIQHSVQTDLLIKSLAKSLLFKEKLLRCYTFHRTCKRKFDRIIKEIPCDKDKVIIYMGIEKQLIILTQENKNGQSIILDEYERALLSTAIERVAGDTLSNVANDGEFEQKLIDLRRKYHNWYYSVTCKYHLPTLRIVPFLSRLISIKNNDKSLRK